MSNGSANQVRMQMEEFKEDRKDERVKKQAVEQSKLIAQRQGSRGELVEEEERKSKLAEIQQLMGQ